MKHLQIFENFSDIDVICKKHGIRIHGNYTINSDGTIDVDGDVILSDRLTKLPLKFGRVTGDFICSYNQLVSLRGCPTEVGGDFDCMDNKLVSLEGGPTEVGGGFNCSYNKLVSLEGGPYSVGGGFNCSNNPISVIYNLFGSLKEFQDSLDYNYLRGTNIVKSRFVEALEEIGKTLPRNIKGYNYI